MISEFMASNKTGIQDQDGDFSDWIELYNYGSEDVSLTGYYLSDDPGVPEKWAFPEQWLASGEYLVVFASGKAQGMGGELHTNFKLSADGEVLMLSSSQGNQVVSGVKDPFPKQRPDLSFGVGGEIAVGSENPMTYSYLLQPTPGYQNAAVLQGEVGQVQFSQERGFYEEPFSLKLSCRTEDASIRYTLDGSVPGLDNGQVYRAPLVIAKTSIVRAVAYRDGFRSSRAETCTYVFPALVPLQSQERVVGEGFPGRWGDTKADYGLEGLSEKDSPVWDEFQDGLRSIPSVSVVMSPSDLFGDETGVYARPGREGDDGERAVSVEYLPTNHEEGFQIDGGVQILNALSRDAVHPKASWRLFFRDEYGPTSLEYPLFGGVKSEPLDDLLLRGFQSEAWRLGCDSLDPGERQILGRSLQQALRQPSPSGTDCHLYVNGLYWGLYRLEEWLGPSFGSRRIGGKKGNYDVLAPTTGDEGASVVAVDGNLEAWQQLEEGALADLSEDEGYFALLGKDSEGVSLGDGDALLDPEGLIDFMLVMLFNRSIELDQGLEGTLCSRIGWRAIRNRKGNQGFRLVVWDDVDWAELLDMGGDDAQELRLRRSVSGPEWLWERCLENEEFRVLVGDRIQVLFGEKGVFAPRTTTKIFRQRSDRLAGAVLCEQFRWGDATPWLPHFERDEHWRRANREFANSIPGRCQAVLDYLSRLGLISELEAPAIERSGNQLRFVSEQLTKRPEAVIHYTTDGSDPRLAGGEVNSRARIFDEAIPLDRAQTIRARVYEDEEWSPLVELAPGG